MLFTAFFLSSWWFGVINYSVTEGQSGDLNHLATWNKQEFLANISLRFCFVTLNNMESSTRTAERSNKHKQRSIYLHEATLAIFFFLKKGTVKRVEATSPPNCVFSEVVRKCSGEISNNSRRSQLREGKQQRFQPSSCPKTVNCTEYI